jgi:hypothetical protein
MGNPSRQNLRNKHTGSKSNLDLAKSWVDICKRHHVECSAYQTVKWDTRNNSQLPNRVIDLKCSRPYCTDGKQYGEYAIFKILLGGCKWSFDYENKHKASAAKHSTRPAPSDPLKKRWKQPGRQVSSTY